jgi:hypothetical protein
LKTKFLYLVPLLGALAACGGGSSPALLNGGPSSGTSSLGDGGSDTDADAGTSTEADAGAAGSCDCTGLALPDICMVCSNGQAVCAHFVCVDAVCETAICQ